MVISEQTFVTLCDRYTLSPRQRQIAKHMLSGVLRDTELMMAMGITHRNLAGQLWRMAKKMHCRGRAQILYRFWQDSLSLTPGQ